MNFESLQNKKVAVLGFGVEGRCAVSRLRGQLGSGELVVLSNGIQCEIPAGIQEIPEPVTANLLKEFDWVIKSPGFSPYRDPVAGALSAGVQLTSVTRLWFDLHPDARVVCITGSKGKSTTAALLAHLLQQAGMDCALGGNIGVPLLDLPQAEVYVLELSSYQCADLAIRPSLAALLNLFPEHLDWHTSVQRYYADKLNLFRARGAGTVILPQDDSDPLAGKLIQHTGDQTDHVLWLQGGSCGGFNIHANQLCWQGEVIADLRTFALRGRHNQQNLLVAMKLAQLLGVAPQRAATGLDSFQALPHRCQVLGMRDGIRYVDDSISTTPHASIAAMDALGDAQKTVVIVGGYDRGVSWDVFASHTRENPPCAVLTLPENGPEIRQLLRREVPGVLVENQTDLESAVRRARKLLGSGGTILLSPGAPSFTAYPNFAARGRHFAALAGFR